ncbi:response regulator [Roseomonas frigidaquae]|uniref:Response regulator n=1 Tax=Falsiroseomonas frigidaquae TaxID=487318 RepID=A0ABX1F1T1_9PROT|nr:response regulator [Falsiroseomonas frigidaquae]NKE46301.1 response regulator [Falsiroseomonas frigidaquae]
MPDSPAQDRTAGADAPAKILVVDDATVVRLYYGQTLAAEGYAMAEAINGQEGIERALCERFDLCVVDVNMPVMDGYAFVRALRAEPATAATPVLMTSTQSGDVDRRLAVEAGANFYLVKPVQPAALAATVAAMIGRRPAPQEGSSA